MKIKTAEQLAAEIAIHRKSGATAKVKLLEKQLLDFSTPVDEVKDTKGNAGVTAINENDTGSSGGAIPSKGPNAAESPLDRIEADHEKEMADARDEMAKAMNEMREAGMTWKQIKESTGDPYPHNKVAAWKRRQQQT